MRVAEAITMQSQTVYVTRSPLTFSLSVGQCRRRLRQKAHSDNTYNRWGGRHPVTAPPLARAATKVGVIWNGRANSAAKDYPAVGRVDFDERHRGRDLQGHGWVQVVRRLHWEGRTQRRAVAHSL